MHTLELKIEDNSLEKVLHILHSLKQGMIKEINMHEKTSNTNDSLHLKEFHKLIRRGNNGKCQ